MLNLNNPGRDYIKLDTRDWELDCGAPIVTVDEFMEERKWLNRVIMTSGGYDPIHPGHISVMLASSLLANGQNDMFVVVVNGDNFLTKKKGKPFMDLKTRCQIVSTIRGVKCVIPYESPVHMDVSEVIRLIKPTHFTKGGDRIDAKSIPEWDTCKSVSCEIVTGVGQPKVWSSSDFLRDWSNFEASRIIYGD